ncbi:MAG TPA: cytochrome c oxidase subunit II [Gemmataceae bacterium]
MQQKGWSIFFGAVLLATFLLCAVAPFVKGWWLPDNVASFGPEVDNLYYVILGFTGFFFVLTEVLLVWAMYRYAWRPNHKADYVEGNHRLELLWTIVPAGILLFIAFAQVNAWERIKYPKQMPDKELLVMQVTARQWDWTMRYPADIERFYFEEGAPEAEKKDKLARARNWAEVPEMDDVYLPDELHCWKGANVRIYLKTQDVLHSFFLPQLRLKQDALPGKTIPMWFNATDFNARFNDKNGETALTDKDKEWEIACAELCGGGHYRMRGLLYVHKDKQDFLNWLKHARSAQNSHKPEKKSTPVAAKD